MTETKIEITDDPPSDVLGKVAVRLIPFMFCLYVAAYLDRINVSFAGLKMNADLHFSDSAFGLGAGMFFLGYFLFGIPSNLMVERVGPRRWISAIMLVWGMLSMSMIFVCNEMSFYTLRFLLGVAEAGFFPGMILYLTYWFPRREHGLAVARFMTAVPAAGVIGGVLSSQVLSMDGVAGLAGWKWLFLSTGSLSFCLGALVFLLLADGPESASWLDERERQWLVGKIAGERAGTSSGGGLKSALLSGRVWLLSAVYFLITLGMYGFQLWLPQIIKNFGGLTNETTALLTAVPALFQAAGMLAVAWHSDGSGERRWHLALSALLASAGLLAASHLQHPLAALMALSMTAFGIWGTVGPFWALTTGYLAPSAAAGGLALINCVGNLGGFAGPWLVGLIKGASHSFAWPLYCLSAALAGAALLALTINAERRARNR